MNAYKGEYMSQYEWAEYNKKYLSDIFKRWKREINKTAFRKKASRRNSFASGSFFYISAGR